MSFAPLPGTGGRDQPRFGTWAVTDPEHPDPRLRGRRYAIPFDRVWSATLDLVGGELRGWHLGKSDEIEGTIRARAVTLVFRLEDDVMIRVGLDEDAQTRVDVSSTSRKGRWDLGTNGRRIRNFLKRLDRKLEAPPELILDPGEGARIRRPEATSPGPAAPGTAPPPRSGPPPKQPSGRR